MSDKVVRFGEFVVQFNPLTGDLTVASDTQVIVVHPVRPGKMRLASARRDETGVKV
jgi:hypothetical protein